jgi:hypothetical protein
MRHYNIERNYLLILICIFLKVTRPLSSPAARILVLCVRSASQIEDSVVCVNLQFYDKHKCFDLNVCMTDAFEMNKASVDWCFMRTCSHL